MIKLLFQLYPGWFILLYMERVWVLGMLVKESVQSNVLFAVRSCTFENLHENANSEKEGIIVNLQQLLPMRMRTEKRRSYIYIYVELFFNGFTEWIGFRERNRRRQLKREKQIVLDLLEFIRLLLQLYLQHNTHQNILKED